MNYLLCPGLKKADVTVSPPQVPVLKPFLTFHMTVFEDGVFGFKIRVNT